VLRHVAFRNIVSRGDKTHCVWEDSGEGPPRSTAGVDDTCRQMLESRSSSAASNCRPNIPTISLQHAGRLSRPSSDRIRCGPRTFLTADTQRHRPEPMLLKTLGSPVRRRGEARSHASRIYIGASAEPFLTLFGSSTPLTKSTFERNGSLAAVASSRHRSRRFPERQRTASVRTELLRPFDAVRAGRLSHCAGHNC